MAHAFSLAHLTVLWASPPELIELAHAGGYDYVGLRFTQVTPGGHAWPLMDDPAMMRETKARIAATGVQVLDIELVKLEPGFDPASYRPFLETSAEVGARHILTQGHDADAARLEDHYAAFCELAQAYGLTSDIEFLPWTATRDLDSAARLVRAVNRPNAGVMVDTLHFHRSGSSLQALEAIPPAWLRFAQLADAPAEGPDSDEGLKYAAREARLFPGEGGLDLLGVLDRLPAEAPLALEIPNTELARRLPDHERVRRAREAALRLLAGEAAA